MRFAPAVLILAFATPTAASGGLPTDRFVLTWDAVPTGRFSPDEPRVAARVVSAHQRAIEAGAVNDALESAANDAARRDLVVDEMESAWEPARRSALEDLREAYRDYAATAGGDRDAHGRLFLASLRKVIETNGRSAATDRGGNGDALLNETYGRVIQEVPDEALQRIEASEAAWVAYRDAFARFATAMDRTDAIRSIGDELAHQRIEELQRESAN